MRDIIQLIEQAQSSGDKILREDQVLNGVRYINNARGYPGENGSWQPIEVDIV
jgi:hypothetical protein